MSDFKSGNITPSTTSNRFESDTQKIVRLHMENKDHVITEDELRNVRVGMTPPADDSGLNPALNNKIGDDGKTPDEPLTPWDAIS